MIFILDLEGKYFHIDLLACIKKVKTERILAIFSRLAKSGSKAQSRN